MTTAASGPRSPAPRSHWVLRPEAEAVQRDCITVLRSALPADDPRTAGALSGLSRTLLARENYADAELALRECLAIREAKLPDRWLRYNTMVLLGAAVAGQARFDEAEPLLLDGYVGMKDRPGATALWKRAALERIVALYEAWDAAEPGKGYAEKAAEWRAKQTPTSQPSR